MWISTVPSSRNNQELVYPIMANSNQGTKFRRISSNNNHTRSASTGNILSSSPPSYPEVIAYNALLGQGPKGHSKVHRNSSSSQGGSFNPLHADGAVGYSAYSITGATSLDSVNPNDYERRQRDRPVSYTHPHSEGPVSRGREAKEGSIGASEGRGRASHVPPSHALLDSSRESFQSGRGLGLYARHSHLRDSMSQDTMGEREFDYQLRYNANTSTTLPTLSLQDTYHSRDHSRVHGRGGRERAMSASNERDLRRNVQEFDVMPIHEGFTHRAMMTPAAVGDPSLPAHLSPHQTSPDTNGRGVSNGGGAPVIIDRQPRASAVEAEHNHSPRNDAQDGLGGDVQQLTYHAVFFSPETGQLFMHIDGKYKPLPNQYFTDNVSIPRGTSFNQSDQRLSATELSGRQTSSSYGMSAPYDYYNCSIAMMILYIMCLNVVVVLACSLPALWFSKKAMKAKYEGDFAGTLSLGTKALCFNIIGGCAHVLILCALIFIPIMLRFAFGVV